MSTPTSEAASGQHKRSGSLPRLLYIGDVPVEASYHGSALLFRLLQTYSPERLRIIESNLSGSLPARRLPQVAYSCQLDYRGRRLLFTRLNRWMSSWLTLRAASRAAAVPGWLDGFQPEAVLTVAHGYGWLTAAEYARNSKLPLHLIVHDDWPNMANLVRPVSAWLHRRFRAEYREAASRLCVSQQMEETYRERYGVGGTVVYPSRGRDAASFAEPPERLGEARQSLVYAFGGTINTAGHVRALTNLADCLAGTRDCLHIYGPMTAAEAEASGLRRPNVRICGLVQADRFIERMRAEADVLFVPMSFEQRDKANMALCFPSKLTDYTAAGLPLLIYGPKYSSAVRWAWENPGVSEVLTSEHPADLTAAIRRLREPHHRRSLARRALAAGREYFDHAHVTHAFHRTLQRGQ